MTFGPPETPPGCQWKAHPGHCMRWGWGWGSHGGLLKAENICFVIQVCLESNKLVRIKLRVMGQSEPILVVQH